MKRYGKHIFSFIIFLALTSTLIAPMVQAASISDTTVQLLLKDINQFRAKNGKAPIIYNEDYASFAQEAADYAVDNPTPMGYSVRNDLTYWTDHFKNRFPVSFAFDNYSSYTPENVALFWMTDVTNLDAFNPYGHCQNLLYDSASVGIGTGSVIFMSGSAPAASANEPVSEACKTFYNRSINDVKNYLYSTLPTLMIDKHIQYYRANSAITPNQFITDIGAQAVDTNIKPVTVTSDFGTVVKQTVPGNYIVTLTAKDSAGNTTTKKVTAIITPSISISKSSATIAQGNVETLSVTVFPVNSPVTYTTSNASVATVTPTGQIKAVGVGTATVTASLSVKGYSTEVRTVAVKVIPQTKETIIQQILKDINQFRAKNGKKAVAYNQSYAVFAQLAADTASEFPNMLGSHMKQDGTYWVDDFKDQFHPPVAIDNNIWKGGANSGLLWISEITNSSFIDVYNNCRSLLYDDTVTVGIGVSTVVYMSGSAAATSNTTDTPEVCKLLHDGIYPEIQNYLYTSNPTIITSYNIPTYKVNSAITNAQFLKDLEARAINVYSKPLTVTSDFSTVVNQSLPGTYTVTLSAKDLAGRITTKKISVTIY